VFWVDEQFLLRMVAFGSHRVQLLHKMDPWFELYAPTGQLKQLEADLNGW